MTVEELKKYLNEHFFYEVDMLYYVASRLQECNETTDNKEVFILLEDFLLHGRNLVEFFYYEPTGRYARAIHFVDDGRWKKERPKETKSILELRGRTSDEIVHLTFKRISGAPPEKRWDWSGCFQDLMAVTKIFLSILPGEYHGDGIMYVKSILDKIKP